MLENRFSQDLYPVVHVGKAGRLYPKQLNYNLAVVESYATQYNTLNMEVLVVVVTAIFTKRRDRYRFL